MTDPLDDLLARLRPDWHAQAACRGAGADLFIVTTARATIEAKQVCAACPVVAECLNYALADPTLRGVWGGQSTRDRARTRATAGRSMLAPARRRKPRQRLTGPLAPRPQPADGDTPRLLGVEMPAGGWGRVPDPNPACDLLKPPTRKAG